MFFTLNRRRSLWTVSTLALISGLTARASLAQDASPPQPAAGAASSAQIEEVVVTSERRSEKLDKVPISEVALTPIQLEQQAVTSTRGLVNLSPSLNFEGGSSTPSTTFSIRGISALSASGGAGIQP